MSETTRHDYPKYVEEFLESMGWSYEDLFNKYLEAEKSPDPRDAALINTQIINFVKEKRAQGYSPGAAMNRVHAISSFLGENGLRFELSNGQRRELRVVNVREKDNFEKAELRTLLESTTSLRNKAMIHALKDTGMAISDLNDLKIRDVRKVLENGERFALIEYFRNKTGERAYTVLGYEALDAIKSWLKWREDQGFTMNPESPLFIHIEGRYRRTDPKVVEDLRKGIALDSCATSAIIRRILETAGLMSGKVLSAHCFRVYNESQLESAGVNKNIVYRIQGRVIPDSGKTYSKGEILSSYIKAYDSLAIGPKPQIIEVQSGRTQELERQLEQLQRQLGEQQRTIDLMMPTFKMAQRIIDRETKLDRLIESSKEP